MKPHARILLACLLLLGAAGTWAQTPASDILEIIPENLQPGSAIAQIPLDGLGVEWTLPGVHHVAMTQRDTLFIEGNGALWYRREDNNPIKLIDQGVRSANFGSCFVILFAKTDGSLWGLGKWRLGKDPRTPIFSFPLDPVEIVGSGVMEVGKGELFLTSDGTLWDLEWDRQKVIYQQYVDRPVPEKVAGQGVASFFRRIGLYYTKSNGSAWMTKGPRYLHFNQADHFIVASNGIKKAAKSQEHFWYVRHDGSLWNFKHKARLFSGKLRRGETPHRILPEGVKDILLGTRKGLLLHTDGTLQAMEEKIVHEHENAFMSKDPFDPEGVNRKIIPTHVTFEPLQKPLATSVRSIALDYSGRNVCFIKTEGSLWYSYNDPYSTPEKVFPPDELPGPTDNRYFYVEGNQLHLNKPLDPTKTHYLIYLRGNAKDGTMFEKWYSLPVLEQPSPPSGILLSNGQLHDHATPQTLVGTLGVTDSDPGDRHSF